jgi:hypothetical protein
VAGYSSLGPWVHLSKKKPIAIWTLVLHYYCAGHGKAQGIMYLGGIGGYKCDRGSWAGPFVEILSRAKQNPTVPGNRLVSVGAFGPIPAPGKGLWRWATASGYSPGSFWTMHQNCNWDKPGLRLPFNTEIVSKHQQQTPTSVWMPSSTEIVTTFQRK